MNSHNIRWLHLSDFHVGKDDYAQRKIFDYIVAHARQRKADGFVPDFIFITGDLANRGKGSEYESFWLEFMAPLQEVIGDGISDRTFAIPGNHDVDREKNPHFDRLEMAGAQSRCFDANNAGQILRQMLMPRFQEFGSNDCTPAKGEFGNDSGSFAKIVEIRGYKIGIAGINTAWLCKDDDDERKLTPGKPLLEHSLDQIAEAKLRIVLGHHPIDWLIPAEQKPIKSLFGRHAILYLHGHLHDFWAEPTYGGGHQFIAIQSGAAFHAREGEKWRNGLLFGEADLTAQVVRLQPWRWIRDQQAWVHATDAFHESYRNGDWWCYPLPGTEIARSLARSAAIQTVQPPKGWTVAKPNELRQHLVPIEAGEAIRFFNGAVPGWHTALSSSIPRRAIVGALTTRFQDAETASRPIVTLLLAAGCEGKTTALLQTAYEVVREKPEWQVLRRTDDAEPLILSEILPVLSKQHRWLVIIDEADRISKDILALIPKLPGELDGRVHFLIACRDSDWNSIGAQELDWASFCTFQKEWLTGLPKEDAEAIVRAWAVYGDSGLGDLAKVSELRRAALLCERAREEAKTSRGAFFGALLAVRHGSDLPNHARLMMERLGHRPIASGGTLRDALTYVAAMHAEGLEFLSRPVLAHVLNCPLGKLHRDVVAPLGQEAAATTTSSFIFTRHRLIAKTIVSILEQDYSQDMAEIFVNLGTAAVEVLKSGQFLPENPSEWRFRFAERFFDSNRKELALRIGEAVLRSQPENFQNLVNLAKLYRRAERSDKAVELFRGVPTFVRMHRGFYTEWSTAEAFCDSRVASTILASYAISDACGSTRVNNHDAYASLSGLCDNFADLFEAYRDISFRDARMAVGIIGRQLDLDQRAEAHFQNHIASSVRDGAILPTVPIAFKLFCQGVLAVETIGVDAVVKAYVAEVSSLMFNSLEQLVRASAEAKRERH